MQNFYISLKNLFAGKNLVFSHKLRICLQNIYVAQASIVLVLKIFAFLREKNVYLQNFTFP